MRVRGEIGGGRVRVRVRDQYNTLPIILQASDGAVAQYFLPIMFYLFVCVFGSTRNVHALDGCSSQHKGMRHTFTCITANLNFKLTLSK